MHRVWRIVGMIMGLAAFVAAVAGGEVIDLSELTDGERRIFGEGDHAIEAVREGDRVVLVRQGGDRPLELTCDLGSDDCQVITTGPGGATTVRVESTRECVNGEGDCEDISVVAIGGDSVSSTKNVWVQKLADCAGDDCDKLVEVILGDGTGHEMIFVTHEGAVLTCPEGDATLRVDEDEVDQTFLCPRHSVPMVTKAESPHAPVMHRRMTIGKHHD